MNALSEAHRITDVETLAKLYGSPSGAAVEKEIDYLHPHYQRLIAASPFFILATGGPDGMDASPRGDAPGFVVVEDEKTLLIPDRRGNNRVDSLRNIIANPRVALLFLIPGIGETLRVNGRAEISTDPALLERFRVGDAMPRSVIVVRVDTVFFQCARAIFHAKLWDPARHLERGSLPSLGTIVSDVTRGRFDGKEYDKGLYDRLKANLY
ncbi:MAG TPA: pyridoxamine 5'-phosphate oxidase family protein [Candidatus Polarisedimenticolia bacterium]|nr:pyridoxamine 5'-phosphate oxidase family protein [Candidatus Polarisedimenticolia bacterium]